MDIYDLLDELYFLISFDDLQLKFSAQPEQFQALLNEGLTEHLIAQHLYDQPTNDFVKQTNIDTEHLYSYHYLATKKGLLFLNGITKK